MHSTDILPPRGQTQREQKAFKDALLVAFHRLGGIEFLVEFGQTHPAEFVRTCARLIPLEVRGMPPAQVTILHAIPPGPLDVHPLPINMAPPIHVLSTQVDGAEKNAS